MNREQDKNPHMDHDFLKPGSISPEDKEDISSWILWHQATSHRIVAMNEIQYRNFKKADLIGIIELPSYVRAESPVEKALRSHEISSIIA